METQPTSIENIIHKKKEAKKKLKTKGLSSIGLSDYRTIGKNTLTSNKTQLSNEQHAIEQKQETIGNKERTRNQIKNQEIDEFLLTMTIEGLIDQQYMSYYAKACHTLGLQLINQLAINARNGREPQKLFAYKVKGAMQLHYKRMFYQEEQGI